MGRGGRRVGAGRKRKATDLKLLQGTFRKDRHGKETSVENKWPIPPKQLELTPDLQQLWNLFRDTHGGLGVAESDFPAIFGTVVLMGRLLNNQRAQRESPEAGAPLIESVKGVEEKPGTEGDLVTMVELKENPLISQEIKLLRELRAYIAITGRSPVDRARLFKGDDDGKANPFDAFLKRK